MVKENSKRWNIEFFGKLNLEVKESIKVLNCMDVEATYNQVKDFEGLLVNKRMEASKLVWTNLNRKGSMMRQKSRFRWICHGDANQST